MNNNTTESSVSTIPVQYSVIKKEISEEEFFRNTVLKYAINKNSNSEFFDCEFSPVTTTYDTLSTARGYSEIDFSTSIGYNRTVNGVNIPKTVTDWKPFSSSKHGEYTASALNGEVITDQKTREKYLSILKNSKYIKSEDSNITDASLFSFTQEEQNLLKERVEYYCKNDTINSLPGDTYKDFHFSIKTNMNSYTKTLIPKHNMVFNYNGQEIKHTANAVGEDDGIININNAFEKNLNKKFYENNKPLSLTTIISACVCFGLFLLGTEWTALTWIAMLPLLITLGAGIPLYFKYIKMINNESAKNKSQKKEKFIEFCNKYNLTPPTEDELKKFENI